MSTTDVQDLRAHLEARDLTAFLQDFEQFSGGGSIELTTVTQRILPGILLELFMADRVDHAQTLTLWKLVRTGRLLLVDNVLIEAINQRWRWPGPPCMVLTQRRRRGCWC